MQACRFSEQCDVIFSKYTILVVSDLVTDITSYGQQDDSWLLVFLSTITSFIVSTNVSTSLICLVGTNLGWEVLHIHKPHSLEAIKGGDFRSCLKLSQSGGNRAGEQVMSHVFSPNKESDLPMHGVNIP